MNELHFYRCPVCGKIIWQIHASETDTVCCGRTMELLIPASTDGISEKHVPVVSTSGNHVMIHVGLIAHPMTEDHYIEWIALQTERDVHFHTLKPGESPYACFRLYEETIVNAYAFCNLHMLWRTSEIDSELDCDACSPTGSGWSR